MADLITNTAADALSKLIQLQATRYDLRLTWSGKGTDDLIALCNMHSHQARLSKHLWTGVGELMRMPEMKDLPEALQAKICSIILGAQALVELAGQNHAQRLAEAPKKPRGIA